MYKETVRGLLRTATKRDWVKKPIRILSTNNLVPSSIWKRLPVEGIFDVKLPCGEAFAYMSTEKDAIGRALFWRGINAWEAETITIFYHLARKAELVADIGANTGVYTLIALGANDKSFVISFEPVDRIRKILLRNIQINGWLGRCEIREEAVSSVSCTAMLHVPFGELPTSASLNPGGFRGYSGRLEEVRVLTMDEVMDEMASRGVKKQLQLVKIDVEGFETMVIRGMRNTIEKDRPDLIVEVNPEAPVLELEELMAEHGYYAYHIRGSGLIPINHITPDLSEKYRNYLFTPSKLY